MPKVSTRTYSCYSREAITLVGDLILVARKGRKMTAQTMKRPKRFSKSNTKRLK